MRQKRYLSIILHAHILTDHADRREPGQEDTYISIGRRNSARLVFGLVRSIEHTDSVYCGKTYHPIWTNCDQAGDKTMELERIVFAFGSNLFCDSCRFNNLSGLWTDRCSGIVGEWLRHKEEALPLRRRDPCDCRGFAHYYGYVDMGIISVHL